jgi:hypothetical protein
MKRVDNNMETISMEEFVVPESLFEALDQVDYGYNNTIGNSSYFNTNNIGLDSSLNNSMMDFNDLDFNLSSETMDSFFEMEQVPEVIEPKVMVTKKTQQVRRPSVIKKSPAMQPITNLGDILTSCGIEHDIVEDQERSSVSSPSSIHSDMELEKNQELIEELEEFFMKTEGKPTVVEEEEVETSNTSLSLQELQGAVTTNMVTEDGQNVIIIIAPSSPSDTKSIAALSPKAESDPEWSPYPHSDSPLRSPPAQDKPRKKYARSKPPKAPSAEGFSKSLWGTQPRCRAVRVCPISNDGALCPAWLLGAFSPQFTAGTVWLGSKALGEVVENW